MIPTDPIILIPTILIILNEGLKRMLGMESKYAVLINWFGGIILNIMLNYPLVDPKSGVMIIIAGFFYGSMAGGLYDGGKFTKDVVKEIRG